MSRQDDSGLAEFVARTVALLLAWLTSWTLGEVQQLVGIVSGLVLLGYTLAQWRSLRRREKRTDGEGA
jgi:hypothetical protein